MVASINIKDRGKVDMTVIPLDSDDNVFIFIENENDIDNPVLKFSIRAGKASILSKRVDVDENIIMLRNWLDEIAIEIQNARNEGIDLSDVSLENLKREEKPYDASQIKFRFSNFSIANIKDMIDAGDLCLSPDFQRNLVWDNRRKSRLIESILLGIPIPVFYMASDAESKLDVIDGLQRLSAIRDFMENKFPLKDLEYLKSCNDCYFDKIGSNHLDLKFTRRFKQSQFTFNIIDETTPGAVKYDLFRRINTGGRSLNPQELRNCLASEKLRSALKAMAHSQEFIDTIGKKSVSDIRMAAQELALRFILFRMMHLADKNLNSYTQPMDEELDSLNDRLSNDKSFDFFPLIMDFKQALINAKYLFGRQSFRKVSTNTGYWDNLMQLNKALFVSWMVPLADYSYEKIQHTFKQYEFIRILGNAIDEDPNYKKYLSYGTNGRLNILYAYQKAKDLLKSEISKRERHSKIL